MITSLIKKFIIDEKLFFGIYEKITLSKSHSFVALNNAHFNIKQKREKGTKSTGEIESKNLPNISPKRARVGSGDVIKTDRGYMYTQYIHK